MLTYLDYAQRAYFTENTDDRFPAPGSVALTGHGQRVLLARL